MTTAPVSIVELPPLRVASAWAYGPSPEAAAWQLLVAWAEPLGLLGERVERKIFGFNNPSPSAGTPNYGYEFWIVVEPDVIPASGVRVLDFSGGLYARMALDLANGDLGEVIPQAWQDLDGWVAQSPYRPASHQWLEGHSLRGEPVELYYPVSPR